MKLPFEKNNRTILEKKKAETDPKFGENPNKRSVETLLNFGIVNIDKPKGPTSHQVSDYLKKILKIKKAGHSGTLDPNVTGVLPIAIGRATRIVDSLLKAGKEYIGIMHLHKEVDEKELKKVFKEFTGKIKQLPPIKSAVKRQERYRKIYYLDIIEIDGKDVLFRVGCQAGTYIRKLCLHPDCEIISDNGLIRSENIFSRLEGIYSKTNNKIQKRIPSERQKFFFKGKLIKITMSSGISFIITPDHRMLISSDQGYIMKQASRLSSSDYIVKSITFPVPEFNVTLSDLLDNSYLIDQKEIKLKVKKAFIKKYRSIRAMNRELGLDRKSFLENSETSIPISHIKKAGIYDSLRGNIHSFKTEKGIKVYCHSLSSDLMYIIGLIASDGNNTREKGTKRFTRIKFHNKDSELITSFERRYRNLFPNFNLSRTKRKDGVVQLDTSNSFLATICSNLGVKSPQKESDILPILYLSKKLVASFLRGYFDGDGTAYHKKKANAKGTYTKIDFFTSSKINAKRIHQMLLKLDIRSAIFHRQREKVISINDIYSKKRFISIVGSNHPMKRERLKLIKLIESGDKNDTLYVGLHYKSHIKEQKPKLYKLGGNLYRLLNSKNPVTRGVYKKAATMADLPSLDQFHIEKIKKIERISYSGSVYDITVPSIHNFLIETGFVSSNCHDIGKRLGTGANMAQLRRTKAGCFNEENLYSLQDVADALWYYENEQNEKFIRKVVQPIENAVTHLPKIYVLDSTVDTMCHGADLKVPGIAKVETDIQVGDRLAVMTLKNELIATGTAKMISKEMTAKTKGIAATTDKVFMKEDTYPKIPVRK